MAIFQPTHTPPAAGLGYLAQQLLRPKTSRLPNQIYPRACVERVPCAVRCTPSLPCLSLPEQCACRPSDGVPQVHQEGTRQAPWAEAKHGLVGWLLQVAGPVHCGMTGVGGALSHVWGGDGANPVASGTSGGVKGAGAERCAQNRRESGEGNHVLLRSQTRSRVHRCQKHLWEDPRETPAQAARGRRLHVRGAGREPRA